MSKRKPRTRGYRKSAQRWELTGDVYDRGFAEVLVLLHRIKDACVGKSPLDALAVCRLWEYAVRAINVMNGERA